MPVRMWNGRRRTNTPITVARILMTKRDRSSGLRTGAYVTDGRRLYRVVSQFTPQAARIFAALEDCRTLEVRPYSPDELYAMRLRPVAMPVCAVPEF